MELYRIKDAPPFRTTHVFREGHVQSLVTTLLLALIAGGVTWMLLQSAATNELDPAGLFLGGLLALGCGLGAVTYGSLCFATFGRRNWLMRYGPDGLLINLRNYRNAHLPDEQPTLALLRTDEIACVRGWTETQPLPGNGSRSPRRPAVFMDVELHHKSTSALSRAVEAEAQTQTQSPLRGLGLSRDKRVRVYVPERGVIRLPWRGSVNWISPGMEHTCRALGATLSLAKHEARRTDLRPLDDGVELEEQLVDLCDQGDMITAMAIARRRYGMSLIDARCFIEEIGVRHAPAL
jgi:hypothetical protein